MKQRRTEHSEAAVPEDEPDVELSSEAEDTSDAKSEASELDETEPIKAEDQDDNGEGVEQQDLPAPTVELDVGRVGTSERGVERMNKGAERQALFESRQMAYVEQGKVQSKVAKGATAVALVKTKKKKLELDPELLDFVNAESRRLGGRRLPIKLALNSDRAGTSRLLFSDR